MLLIINLKSFQWVWCHSKIQLTLFLNSRLLLPSVFPYDCYHGESALLILLMSSAPYRFIASSQHGEEPTFLYSQPIWKI